MKRGWLGYYSYDKVILNTQKSLYGDLGMIERIDIRHVVLGET